MRIEEPCMDRVQHRASAGANLAQPVRQNSADLPDAVCVCVYTHALPSIHSYHQRYPGEVRFGRARSVRFYDQRVTHVLNLHLSPLHLLLPHSNQLPNHPHCSATSMASVPTSEKIAHPNLAGTQVGFIGLGNMGSAMALNLAQALPTLDPPLPPLTVFNRTESKVDAFATQAKKAGAQYLVAKSLADVVQTCSIVFTSLTDDEAALAVYGELCKADDAGRGKGGDQSTLQTIWVDTSTIYPDTTGAIERQVSSHGRRHFVAAPAFGPPPAARAKQLVFATGGSLRFKQAISPFLSPCMGRKIMDFGGNHEVASRFKLLGNSFILGLIELLSESMTLADKTDVGAGRFFEFLEELYPAPPLLNYARKVRDSNFRGEDGLSLSGGIKDANLIRRLANEADCPVSVIDVAHQHMVSARANAPPGAAELDWSSLVAGQRLTAGLDPWKGKSPGLLRD